MSATVALPCCDEKRMCHAQGKINSVRTGNSPASLYQRLKQIQNTVRVQSSLYAMNVAALNTDQTPLSETQTILNSGSPYIGGGGVNWNQMSDRRIPHVQKVVTADRGKSSTRHTIVRLRPGAGSPGGIGVDIKHNSYDRFLNRTKAKLLKRGPVSQRFGDPIPPSRAFPVKGGKTLKTAIVTAPNCVQCAAADTDNVERLYKLDCFADAPAYHEQAEDQQTFINSSALTKYKVGDFVLTKKCKRGPDRLRAQIVTVSPDETIYTVKFDDCCTLVKQYADLKPYKKCSPHLFSIAYVQNGKVSVCDTLEFETLRDQWNQ